MLYRNKIAVSVETWKKDPLFKNYNLIHTGLVGCRGGEEGRVTLDKDYLNILCQADIVITCNPDYRSGDYRLFEAFAGGAMVFVDTMLMPVKNPFVHKKHLYYYDRDDMLGLKQAVLYYLNHPSERIAIASAGLTFVKKHHLPINRIQEMIDEVCHIKQFGTIQGTDLSAYNTYLRCRNKFAASSLCADVHQANNDQEDR